MPIVIMFSPARRSLPRSAIWWGRRRRSSRLCGPSRSPMAMAGVGTVTEDEEASVRYIVVKALEDGVVNMGLIRGKDTRSHHSERLDGCEVPVRRSRAHAAA